ncbi:MAG: putative toxin-antitoxin system toxin component, PIN family [bacterium]
MSPDDSELIKAVLDTNVLISAIGWSGKPYAILKKWKNKEFTLITSIEILTELAKILRRDFGYTDDFAYYWYQLIGSYSSIINPGPKIEVIKGDPDDNKFLECARAGKAKYIVSGDIHLLNLKVYKGIKIVKPSEFLEIMDKKVNVEDN